MSKTLCWLIVAVPLAAIGCAHASAKTTPEMPALDMPAPPPRDVEPGEPETPPPASSAAEPARSTPARPRPSSPPPSSSQPSSPPGPQPARPEPPTVLQTAPATAEGETERGIRAVLLRANADLGRVDYRALNADARTQYDTAKRFVGQADEAMRAKNLVFAKNLADKAAALASQLSGR